MKFHEIKPDLPEGRDGNYGSQMMPELAWKKVARLSPSSTTPLEVVDEFATENAIVVGLRN